jgi:poly(3-hydroxybutyrate) depolymerase
MSHFQKRSRQTFRSGLVTNQLPVILVTVFAASSPGCNGNDGQSGQDNIGGTTTSGGSTGVVGPSGGGGIVNQTETSVGPPRGGSTTGGASATGGVSSVGGTSTSTGSSAIGGSTPGGTSSSNTTAKGGSSTTSSPKGGTGSVGGTSSIGGTAVGGASGIAEKSVGCGKATTLTSGSRTIQSGGQNRSYMLRIPANYDNTRPYRLVFAFHWNGGTMGDVDGGGTSGYTWSYYGLREQADATPSQNTIFVAPQGNGNGWANTGGADLTFVDDLLKFLESELCVDKTRIFSMGFSYGGGMTFALACARATVFRAAAVYAGAQLSGCSDGTKPIAYIGVHGLRDPTCSIAGGRTLRDKFVKNNGCTEQSPPEPAANSLNHVCTTYSGCTSGYPVRWCAFDGAGHSPAPVDGTTSDSGGGDKTWTKAEVWKFFTQF